MSRGWKILHIPTAKLCALYEKEGPRVYRTKELAERDLFNRHQITEHEDCIELQSSCSNRFSALDEHFMIIKVED